MGTERFNPVYMIDFVDGKKVNKVSYAASIGLNEIPEKYVGQYSSLLGDFTSLAVREEEGARLLKDRCGIVANIVLDPTLLVNVAEYRALQSTKYLPFLPSKYIFCYFLNKNIRIRLE